MKKQSIIINGTLYSVKTLSGLISNLSDADKEIGMEVYHFLLEWFNENPTITVRTSGSTGTPKQMEVRKDNMMNSARLTCDFLNLNPGDSALLCMSVQYIAGKMMVVRALVGGLNLMIETPSGYPLKRIDQQIDFAAMVPMQIYNSLRDPIEKKRLMNIKTLIIGGGAINEEMEAELIDFPNAVYSTYGMTETLSHIALRRLNGNYRSEYYHPFSSVTLSLSSDQTLIIDAPLVCNEHLITNDVADLRPDSSFRILGRKDNVINSGGIKIQIEEVEKLLTPLIRAPFAITYRKDPLLGQAVVLLVAKLNTDIEDISSALSQLPKYWQPRRIIYVDEIPLTETSKINRAACHLQAEDNNH